MSTPVHPSSLPTASKQPFFLDQVRRKHGEYERMPVLLSDGKGLLSSTAVVANSQSPELRVRAAIHRHMLATLEPLIKCPLSNDDKSLLRFDKSIELTEYL